MRRLIRITGFTLVWAGVLALGIVGYQLFITDLLNGQVQAAARAELPDQLAARREAAVPVTVPTTVTTVAGDVPSPTTTAPIEYFPEESPPEGDALGVLRIPAIDLERVMFVGVTSEVLAQGPGFMPWTSLPGQPGNAVVSGHRTTHGAPFFDLDLLKPGDVIEVETAIGTHTYTVRDTIIVSPTDVWVTEQKPGAWLTLTTCNPKYSASQRLIVQAELTAGPNLDYIRYLDAERFRDAS